MAVEGLGKQYEDGQEIVREGDVGEHMFVIQDGMVEVVRSTEGGEVQLATLGPGDVFGEMALFEREVRSATVRALGPVRVLTIDRRTFFRRIQEDPSLAFRILHKMSERIRKLNQRVAELESQIAAKG